MTKYLFLLGFSFFSISFFSIPVASAISVIYTGIVYDTNSRKAISCNDERGMHELKRMRDGNGNSQSEGEEDLPTSCKRGNFSKFILFEEEAKGGDGRYTYMISFISSDGGDNWKQAYVEIKSKSNVRIKDCRSEPGHGRLGNDCTDNFNLYEEYRNNYYVTEDNTDIFTDGSDFNKAPDSIKQKKVVE